MQQPASSLPSFTFTMLKMRYNLALLPEHTADQLIKLAALFSNGADYLLCSQRSHPHITLAQFYAPKDYNLNELWLKAKKVQDALYQAPLELHFIQSKHTSVAAYVWLALLPEYHPQVYALHQKLVALLKQFKMTSIGAVLEKYMPHLTLARSTDLSLIEKLKTIQMDLKDTFHLALGKSDDMGQFFEILKIQR